MTAVATDTAAKASAVPALRVTDLSTHLFVKGNVLRAVDGVSFDIGAGETLAIVGESGCGKSMTALSIMGLLPASVARIVGGSVELDGVGDLARLGTRQLRRVRGNHVSMIFQEPMTSLNPVFRIGWQIAEALRQHEDVGRKEARERAIHMLETVGIPLPEQRVDAYPHQLSGGMRQRVMIAMALICKPKVMLADEPTTALDVTIQAQILALMNRLKRDSGTAILFITHDLGVVAKMADRVCVMYAGVVVEQAPVRSLFARPLHPYTQGLMQSVPRMGEDREGRLHTIKGAVPSLAALPRGCRFQDRCPAAHAPCFVSEPPLARPEEASDADGHTVRCWLHVKPREA